MGGSRRLNCLVLGEQELLTEKSETVFLTNRKLGWEGGEEEGKKCES